MNSISNYILPCFIVFTVIFGLLKKIDVFDAFIDGAKNGFNIFLSILPSLTALFLVIEMMKSSGALEILCSLLAPLGDILKIPKEVLPMCILSPFQAEVH